MKISYTITNKIRGNISEEDLFYNWTEVTGELTDWERSAPVRACNWHVSDVCELLWLPSYTYNVHVNPPKLKLIVRQTLLFICYFVLNRNQIELAVQVLKILLNALDSTIIISQYGESMVRAIKHPNCGVKELVLTEVRTNTVMWDVMR